MRPTTPSERNACPLELIEAYLDADLDEASQARVKAHLAECQACACDLEEAREVRDALRGLPEAVCPPAVVDAVMATVRAESQQAQSQQNLTEKRESEPEGAVVVPIRRGLESFKQPGLWLAAAAVLFAAFSAAQFFDRSEPAGSTPLPLAHSQPATPDQTAPAQHTPEQVAQAEEDVRTALAIFAQLSDRVGNIVEEQVIGRRVATAPAAAIDAIRQREEKAQ